MSNREFFWLFGVVIFICVLIIVGALTLTKAHAQDAAQQDAIAAMKRRPGRITCAMVKSAVYFMGAEEAEKRARAEGASEARIAKWKKCK